MHAYENIAWAWVQPSNARHDIFHARVVREDGRHTALSTKVVRAYGTEVVRNKDEHVSQGDCGAVLLLILVIGVQGQVQRYRHLVRHF